VAGALWYALPQAGPWPLVLALPPWLARLVLTGRLSRRTPFDVPLLLFLLMAGVGVWAAYDRQAAWAKFWLVVGGGLLFYALANAEPMGERRVWLLSFFGAGVALYFLATHDWDAFPAKIAALTRLGRSLQAPLPTLPGHRLHPNVAGGIMAMMAPYAGWVTVKAWQELRRSPGRVSLVGLAPLAAGLGALGLTIFGLLMTTSRGAWIALAGALLLAELWLVSGWPGEVDTRRRSRNFLGLLALVLVLGLVVGITWRSEILAVLDSLPGGNTAVGRIDLVRNTLMLVRDYPFIGAGLGGYQMLYSTYSLLLHVGFSVHSHNLLLNVAVEQGLPAVVALVWMWLLFGAAVWRGLFGSGRQRYPAALGAAALSLVVLLLHGLVDDVLYGSRGVLLLFVPLAFSVPLTRETQRARLRGTLGLPIVIVLVLGLALLWRKPVSSLIYSNLGAVHQSQVELGVYSWPKWPIQDAVRREMDVGQAVAEFERALVLYPRNATANRRLGMIELSLGEYEEALAHLGMAYEVEPGTVTTQQLYGEALIVNGRVDEGRALWAEVNNEQRQLEARAYWYKSIGDAERAAWVRQAIDGR
jgi:tetratricopeptide (TPR) repeat protein